MTSPTIGSYQGTVHRGNLGSSSYYGHISLLKHSWEYVFYLETRSFHFTRVGDGTVDTWSNGSPAECLFHSSGK